MDAYREDVNTVLRFVREHMLEPSVVAGDTAQVSYEAPGWVKATDAGDRVTVISEFYEGYRNWRFAFGEDPVTHQKFTKQLPSIIPEYKSVASIRKIGRKAVRVLLMESQNAETSF